MVEAWPAHAVPGIAHNKRLLDRFSTSPASTQGLFRRLKLRSAWIVITWPSASPLNHLGKCWACLAASGLMQSVLMQSFPHGNSLLPHVWVCEPRGVAPSRRQRLRESHEAVSTGVMSIHLGKCFLFLFVVQVVYVLLNKVHVPYANECWHIVC